MLPFYFEWLKVSALTWHTALPPQNKETIIISSTCYRQKNQFLSDKMDSCNISEEKEPSINYPCCAEPATSAPLSREFVRNAVSSPTLDLLNQNLHLNQKPDYLWTGEPWCIRTGPGFKSLSLSAEESRQIQKAAVGHTKEYVIETYGF